MAEFLIYNKDHWMDMMTPERYQELIVEPEFQQKYLARYRRGDIVEVRPDGFYTSTLKGDLSKWPFRVVSVPGVKPDKMYMEPIIKNNIMLKRRRFSMLTGVAQKITTVLSINDLTLTDKSI